MWFVCLRLAEFIKSSEILIKSKEQNLNRDCRCAHEWMLILFLLIHFSAAPFRGQQISSLAFISPYPHHPPLCTSSFPIAKILLCRLPLFLPSAAPSSASIIITISPPHMSRPSQPHLFDFVSKLLSNPIDFCYDNRMIRIWCKSKKAWIHLTMIGSGYCNSVNIWRRIS